VNLHRPLIVVSILAALVVLGLVVLTVRDAIHPSVRIVGDATYERDIYGKLRSGNPSERADAIHHLALPIDTHRDLEPALGSLRSDPSILVRKTAANSLRIVLFDEAYYSARLPGAAPGLSQNQARRIYLALLNAMAEDPSAKVRIAAAYNIDDTLAAWRSTTSDGLYQYAKRTSNPYLKKALRDPDDLVRGKARSALKVLASSG